MSTEENKALEYRILEEALTKHNLAIADELIGVNWLYHGTAGMNFQGREGFRQMHSILYAAFPDLRVKVEDMIAEGDKVVSRFTVQGTHHGEFLGVEPTGRQFKVSGIAIGRFVDGMEVEVWDIVDQFGMMQQLGAIPLNPSHRGRGDYFSPINRASQ